MLDSLRSLPVINHIPLVGKSHAEGNAFNAQIHSSSGSSSANPILHPEKSGSSASAFMGAVNPAMKQYVSGATKRSLLSPGHTLNVLFGNSPLFPSIMRLGTDMRKNVKGTQGPDRYAGFGHSIMSFITLNHGAPGSLKNG